MSMYFVIFKFFNTCILIAKGEWTHLESLLVWSCVQKFKFANETQFAIINQPYSKEYHKNMYMLKQKLWTKSEKCLYTPKLKGHMVLNV
jgi:hypothetical protein